MQVDDVVLGLAAGVGIALSPDGATAYYVEWSVGELMRLDTQTGAISKVRSGLAYPQDVEVDWKSGDIFISERTGSIEQGNGRDSHHLVEVGGAPHQMAYVESGTQRHLYVVCYDSGQLHRIDVATKVVTTIASGLGHPVGLVVDRTAEYAFVTEQDKGALTRIELATGVAKPVVSGLISPFFLAWDRNQSGIYCVQRDPLNNLIRIDPTAGTTSVVADGLAWRPSGVASTTDDKLIYICADQKLQVISADGNVPGIKHENVPFLIHSVEFNRRLNQAFNLKHHETGATIAPPEYVRGSRNEPAACLAGSRVYLKVVLRRQPGYAGGAYAIGATGNLGGVRRVEIAPTFLASGLSVPIDFEFMWPLPGTVGKPDVNLSWYARRLPGPSVPTTIGPTVHRVYLLLARPTEPWMTTVPWVAALEIACGWAEGAWNPDDAAAKIAARYNGCGRVSYDTISGSTFYGFDAGTGPHSGYFLSQMIERLNGGPGQGEKVNCTDSACTVSTFANIVGCDLWQSRMTSSFLLNPMIAIGYGTWAIPFNGRFSYHEVAWKGQCTANDALFDGCLHVDGDVDPMTPPHAPLLPANIVFGDCTAMNYRLRLCPSSPGGCATCMPAPGTRKRRPVG